MKGLSTISVFLASVFFPEEGDVGTSYEAPQIAKCGVFAHLLADVGVSTMCPNESMIGGAWKKSRRTG